MVSHTIDLRSKSTHVCLLTLNVCDLFYTYDRDDEIGESMCRCFLHQNLHLINDHITTILGHFCVYYMKVFHKTEIQMVILRC